MEDMKLARYGAFDNKEHEEMVSRPKNEERVLRHYGEFPHELLNKQVYKYLFSTHHSKSSLINHYTSHGSMTFIERDYLYRKARSRNMSLGLSMSCSSPAAALQQPCILLLFIMFRLYLSLSCCPPPPPSALNPPLHIPPFTTWLCLHFCLASFYKYVGIKVWKLRH